MMDQPANRSGQADYQRFEFLHFDSQGHTARFYYQLSGDRVAPIRFEERLEWPLELPAPDQGDPAVYRCLGNIHRMLGISYYKSCCPAEIILHGEPLSPPEADFWEQVYTFGLGEFFYRNDLDPRGRVRFPRRGSERPPLVCRKPATERVLLLIGGGKDSAVSYELIRASGVPVDLFSLGSAPWIQRLAAAFGAPHRVVGRQLDPQLFQLNRAGAYNGHIPISACIAFIGVLVAMVGGYSAVVASNERTASYGNLNWHGMEINHQWSKGLGFEQAFQALQRAQLVEGPDYFSLLRPLSELAICGLFARRGRYFADFTSCNANFQLGDTRQTPRWCGRCPKCIFVYVMLAPHLEPAPLQAIFGADLLADAANLPMLEALIGLSGHKPFECVGSPEEVLAALSELVRQGRLQLTPVYPLYEAALAKPGVDIGGLWEAQLLAGPESAFSPVWRARFDAYLRSC
ncbi:MAG: endonuclease domain-containing protein [Magnetococcales bacterium]|nr:endonuclease domain-containing protein [Magnetococcales bacterium]